MEHVSYGVHVQETVTTVWKCLLTVLMHAPLPRNVRTLICDRKSAVLNVGKLKILGYCG